MRPLANYLKQHHLALLAIVLATGGTSYAAATRLLPKNSVASPQVVNGSLQKVDLSRKAIAALRGQRGTRGPAGATGATGATGARGAQGLQGPPGTDFHYAHVVVVKATGTASANGAALVQSLAGITDNASHSYLLLLEPGVYDVGVTTVELKPNVDLAGSGAAVTTITGTGHSPGYTAEVKFVAPRPTEVRNVTIESTASSGNAEAFNVDFIGKARLDDVVLSAESAGGGVADALVASGLVTVVDSELDSSSSGTGNFSQGVVNGGTVTLLGTTVRSGSTGTNGVAWPVNSFGETDLRSSDVRGTGSSLATGYGVVAQGTGSVQVDGSIVSGSTYLSSNGGTGAIRIGASRVQGATFGTAPTCVVSYTFAFTPVNAACA